MKQANLRLWLAGFLATLLMTVVVHPLLGERLPNVEFATMMVSGSAGHSVEAYSAVWWLGLLEHVVCGVVLFPFLYSITYGRIFRRTAVAGGVLWGVTLWLVHQSVVLPILGYGWFGSEIHDPRVFSVLTFLPHAIYGLVFGAALGFGPAKRRQVTAA